MAIDLAALKAKLAAKKALETPTQAENKNETPVNPVSDTSTVSTDVVSDVAVVASPVVITPANLVDMIAADKPIPEAVINILAGAGTSRTVSIDHMDFLSKMQDLEEAIHKQHPTMPVLLMTIHKQLTKDPELVSILSEEEIGIIVSGLKIQTKTELIGTVAKQSKARDKKTKLDASMF